MNNLSPDLIEPADILSLGGRSASATLAAGLSEDPSRRVLLLEAGPAFSPDEVPAELSAPEDVAAPMSTGPRMAMEYVVEAGGTFVLVFAVGSPAAGANPWAPLAIGALLRAVVDAGLRLLGGHHPAVTLAVLRCHQVGLRDAAAYWLVQLGVGLLAAAVVARAIVDPAQLAATATMSLAGRSLMAAFAADLAALVAEQSRKQAGV
jgi:glycerol uptake facilitator-like aquaporin